MCLTLEHCAKLIKEQQRASDYLLVGVPEDHVRIMLLWFAEVFEQVLQQAFDRDELTASEISIHDEADDSEELVH